MLQTCQTLHRSGSFLLLAISVVNHGMQPIAIRTSEKIPRNLEVLGAVDIWVSTISEDQPRL